MTLYVAHNDPTFEAALKSSLEGLVKVVCFDMSYSDELVKARKLKAGWSAVDTPFALLKDENEEPLEAFYSEVGACTVDNIVTRVKNYQ